MNNSQVLETAWANYAQLRTNASLAKREYTSLRVWVMILALITIALALSICTKDLLGINSHLGELVEACLVLVPILALVIWSFANKLRQGQYWQVLHQGALATVQSIYLYRTLFQEQENRHQWLQGKIISIQEQIVEQIGGNLVLKPYDGPLPPPQAPEVQGGDLGINDLLLEEYINYRLKAQLEWHSQAVKKLDNIRKILGIGIIICLGLSPILLLAGTQAILWIALTTSLAIVLMGWLEFNRVDDDIYQYNHQIWQLKAIRDTWQSFNLEQKTLEQAVKLILSTEKVLWNAEIYQSFPYHNPSTSLVPSQSSDLLTKALNAPPLTLINPLLPQSQEKNKEINALNENAVIPTKNLANQGLPHAFIVMPFGRKKGPDGRWIDFDRIYYTFIKPAVEKAGFESFRADEETVTGDILTDMLQEILLADLVVADLSIDNANVFYELGIRHALRKRGIVHIQAGRAYLPYDIFNVRTLPYHCNEDGLPDPLYLEKDQQALINMIRTTWESDTNRIHSPLFNILTGLPEPDRQLLRTPLATGYWQEYEEWRKRVKVAQIQNQIGDILLLTEEVKNPFIKCKVLAEAGQALNKMENHALALKEYRQGLTIEPQNSQFRQEEAFHLSRLCQYDEAIVKLEALLADEPHNIDAISYLGRVYKDVWRSEWNQIPEVEKRLKRAYEFAHLLEKASQTYLHGYRLDQNHYYSGINALGLLVILEHLVNQVGEKDSTDYQFLREQIPSLIGAIKFSLESQAQQEPNNPWIFLSLGDLAVYTAKYPQEVTSAYKKAMATLWNDKFALNSVLHQLSLLESLQYRLEYVQPAISVLNSEMDRLDKQKKIISSDTARNPSQVFLFSGHMIDRQDRPKPRFPAAMEEEAHNKLEAVLDRLNADDNDLAIAPGIACGGDILFLEACLRRNMRVEIYLPFVSAEFIEYSVSFAGDSWVERFYQIQNHPNVTLHFQPDRLGPVPAGDSPFSRNNRWALYSTLMYGIERVRLIVLWDGKGGDGRGGTHDMVYQVRQVGGIVEHIDTTKFDYWEKACLSH